MTADDLRTLLDYHYWARDRLLDAVESVGAADFTRPLGSSFPSIRETVVHVYSSESLWNARWHGVSPTAPVPPERFGTASELRGPWQDLERDVRATLAALGDAGIDRVFEYRMLNGQPRASPFAQTVQHIVNHASYHRGQITTLLRQIGATPPRGMDLIAFHWERAAR